jgi:hypothetical protein
MVLKTRLIIVSGTEYLFRRKRQENYCRDMPKEVIFTEENKPLS